MKYRNDQWKMPDKVLMQLYVHVGFYCTMPYHVVIASFQQNNQIKNILFNNYPIRDMIAVLIIGMIKNYKNIVFPAIPS